MLEPNVETGFEGVLKQWRIEARKDIVIDTNVLNRLVGLGPASPMVVPAEASTRSPRINRRRP